MEVKIYREKENENLIINENELSEYNKLAIELGLMTIENIDNKEKTPVVYPYINKGMDIKLKSICPVEVSIESYKKSTIPLEVLKVYKYAKENEMFESFYIWYDDADPDPMLIGKKYENEDDRKKGYSWNQNQYLIARWGDCSMELNELLNKGDEILRGKLRVASKTALSKINDIISNPEKYMNDVLSGRGVRVDILSSDGSIPNIF